jgi:hypothetical protein
MANLINLTAECKPSLLMRKMLKHSCDVSEGTQYKVVAKRRILNRTVIFYHNGLRVIQGTDLSEQEMHDSEILRLAHASLLIGEGVGDKKLCYVDATKNPVEVWLYGMLAEQFIKTSRHLVETQQLGLEFLLEEPIRKTVEKTNGRNVRLFRKQPGNPHLSHKLLVETECSCNCSVDD